MKTIAVIQCNYVGWEGTTDVSLNKDPDGRLIIEEVIERGKRLKRIDEVPVIACPDEQENQIFARIAQQVGCRCFMGSTTDVIGRLSQACLSVGGERIAWLQGIHYFLDVSLMDGLITWADSGAFDYARCLDGSCKQTLGQVVTIEAIDRARSMIAKLPADQQRFFAARAFAFMRARPNQFRIGLFERLPQYDERTLTEMRLLAGNIYVQERALHTAHACSVGDVSRGRYGEVLEFVPPGARVLDIACGTGYGSQLVAQRASHIVGVDVSADAIKFAMSHYGRYADFQIGSAEAIPLEDDAVDLAMSIATIEHVKDDAAFIRELRRVVRPGGRLILYTPQNRMGRIPIWPWHVREYSVSWLKTVVGSSFEIEQVLGWQNGVVTPGDERGDGMFLIASKRGR